MKAKEAAPVRLLLGMGDLWDSRLDALYDRRCYRRVSFSAMHLRAGSGEKNAVVLESPFGRRIVKYIPIIVGRSEMPHGFGASDLVDGYRIVMETQTTEMLGVTFTRAADRPARNEKGLHQHRQRLRLLSKYSL